VVELGFIEPTFDEGPRVNAWCGVALNENLVAEAPICLAPEEVVKPHLVERRCRCIGGEVPSNAERMLVGPGDHRGGIPTHDASDLAFHIFVTGEPRLLI
jgi:hypothetical protein